MTFFSVQVKCGVQVDHPVTWFSPVCPGPGGVVPPTEGRYSTMGRASASTVGTMLLQSRLRSSSNPDIPAPHSAEDTEVKNILSAKVLLQIQGRGCVGNTGCSNPESTAHTLSPLKGH